MNIQEFESRKKDHIRHALDPKNQAQGWTGLEQIHLFHDALPDFDLKEVSLKTSCFGRELATPFYVSGMTAGHADAVSINQTLARACAKRGWAMGVGSQRRQINEDLTSDSIDSWRKIRAEAEGLVLLANLGITQLCETPIPKIQRIIESTSAQALAVHLNPLQEALQPEGTPHFKGALSALEKLIHEIKIPVVLKETGCGFSPSTLAKVGHLKLAAIDVSGFGGTHWGRIEGARAPAESTAALASQTFADWGETTVSSVLEAARVLTGANAPEVWASGGVRSGLDAAKLIALGAHRVGYAQPALEAALQSQAALENWMELQEFELKVALFCTNSKSPQDLRQKDQSWKAKEI